MTGSSAAAARRIASIRFDPVVVRGLLGAGSEVLNTDLELDAGVGTGAGAALGASAGSLGVGSDFGFGAVDLGAAVFLPFGAGAAGCSAAAAGFGTAAAGVFDLRGFFGGVTGVGPVVGTTVAVTIAGITDRVGGGNSALVPCGK